MKNGKFTRWCPAHRKYTVSVSFLVLFSVPLPGMLCVLVTVDEGLLGPIKEWTGSVGVVPVLVECPRRPLAVSRGVGVRS